MMQLNSASHPEILKKLGDEIMHLIFGGKDVVHVSNFKEIADFDKKKLDAKKEVELMHREDVERLTPDEKTIWRVSLAVLNRGVKR